MSSFFDADKFKFVLMEDGHLTPVHHRDLGEKEGHLYSKKVSWVDATINDVPLEQTFRFEDEITHVENSVDGNDGNDRGYIIVNERLDKSTFNDDDDDASIHQKKKWMKRLEKAALNPISLPEAKKKKTHQRFPVKPKTETQRETEHYSYDKFQELVDTKSPGILGSFIYTIRCKDGYKKNISWDDGDDRGYNVKKEVRYIPKFKEKTYCPPEHWLTPIVQWKDIWLEMDEIEHGYKRDYVYVPEGELCPDSSSIMGPAIYFFETPCETIEEYEKYWNSSMYKCWIAADNDGSRISWPEIEDSGRLSNASYLSRVEKTYLENPSTETFNNYQDGWRLTQPGYHGYYQGGSTGWLFKVFTSDHTKRDEIAPQPHL